MKLNRENRLFLRDLFHPRVFIFLLIGVSVVFLTFLTDNNALEIAISGFASVFTGIAVNNFSSLETHKNDILKFKNSIGHSVELLEIVKSQISLISKDVNAGNYESLRNEFDDLEKFIGLSIKVVKDEILD
jgi:hypothetical protein